MKIQVNTYSGSKIGALYLRHGCGQHLVPVGALRVQPVTLAGARTARATRTLLRCGLDNIKIKIVLEFW